MTCAQMMPRSTLSRQGQRFSQERSGRIFAAVLMERLPQEMVPCMCEASAEASRTKPRSNKVRPSRKVTVPPQS